jgi:predicted kinase
MQAADKTDSKAHLIILMGNVGTGKTTYCNEKFKNQEIIVRPDDWKDLNTDEIQKRLIKTVEEGLAGKKTVVVDGNNLSKKARDLLLYFKATAKCQATLVNFGKGDEISLERRIAENQGQNDEFWKTVHDKNASIYEEPSLDEGFAEIIDLSKK